MMIDSVVWAQHVNVTDTQPCHLAIYDVKLWQVGEGIHIVYCWNTFLYRTVVWHTCNRKSSVLFGSIDGTNAISDRKPSMQGQRQKAREAGGHWVRQLERYFSMLLKKKRRSMIRDDQPSAMSQVSLKSRREGPIGKLQMSKTTNLLLE